MFGGFEFEFVTVVPNKTVSSFSVVGRQTCER